MAKKEITKKQPLEDLVKELNKELKTESPVQVASSSKGLDIPRLRTGSLTYDICTGGGFPFGRNTVLYGAESSGKTTVALMAVAQFFKTDDKRAILIVDAEYAFDKNYALKLGADENRMIIIQPDHIGQAAPVLKYLLEKNAIGAYIIDSIAALMPLSVIENETDASNIGKHAQAIGNMFKQSNGLTGRNKVAGIWINQIRDKIGGYGGGISLPAGHAPKFYASIMIKVMRGSKVKNDDGSYTNQGWIRVEKNKTFPPYQEGKYDMEHGSGISLSSEVRDYGIESGVIYKKGNSFYYDETFENDIDKSKDHVFIGKSKDAAKEFLEENVDFTEQLSNIILKTYINK
jgi:recombination protein RecA